MVLGSWRPVGLAGAGRLERPVRQSPGAEARPRQRKVAEPLARSWQLGRGVYRSDPAPGAQARTQEPTDGWRLKRAGASGTPRSHRSEPSQLLPRRTGVCFAITARSAEQPSDFGARLVGWKWAVQVEWRAALPNV